MCPVVRHDPISGMLRCKPSFSDAGIKQARNAATVLAVVSATTGMQLLILDSREYKELGVTALSPRFGWVEASEQAGSCSVSALERSKRADIPCLGGEGCFGLQRHIVHEECGASASLTCLSAVSNKMFAWLSLFLDRCQLTARPDSIGFTACSFSKRGWEWKE